MDPVQEFRSEIERLYPNGARRRYNGKLRQLAVQHSDTVKRRGGTLQQAARDLGVDSNSVRKWREHKSDVGSRMDHITVVADDSYIVLGPAGLRVECRSAQAVAQLFRALG